MKRWKIRLVLLAVLTILFSSVASAEEKMTGEKVSAQDDRKAVVLAVFGTANPAGIKPYLDIKARIEAAYPGLPVKLAFTSNQIRQMWHKRQDNSEWIKDHPDLPRDIFSVKTPLATIADLQDQGHKIIVVQSLHIFAGEEYLDLKSMVMALDGITTIKPKWKPFKKVALGRPALGEPGPAHPYQEDIKIAVKALKTDVDLARQEKAALVYMGHGNQFYSTGIYGEFQEAMRQAYPDVQTFVGVVEGFPSLGQVKAGLIAAKIKKVLLLPFLLVAGEHVARDMCGDDEESWRNNLRKAGVTVDCSKRALGALEAWQEIYLNHLKDVLADYQL